MSSDAHVTVADNTDFGINAETAACERWALERVEDEDPDWFDAQFTAELEGAFGTIVPADTVVEVKSCRLEYRNRRGRWWIRRRNHERLLDEGGEYVLSVYRSSTAEVLRQALVSAVTVDAIVDGDWWDAGAGGNEAEEYVQLPWSTVFEEVP